MKTNSKTKDRKTGHLSFYLVLMLCMAMISVSCLFAYAQTKNEIVLDMNSVMEMETAIPRETTPKATVPPTESPTEPESQAPTVPIIKASIQPLETAPTETETEPLTQQAAVIDAPETAPEVTDITEEVEAASAEPPCWPLNGEILEAFSNGELVKSATTGIWQTHNGVDIAGTLGDTVCAVNAGIVTNIENDALWGVSVTIDHKNGIITKYCNLNAGLTVNEGQKVEKGAVIGALGDTADAESAMQTHLHFEVMQGAHYLDPAAYLASPEA